jgi:hypothetical protein
MRWPMIALILVAGCIQPKPEPVDPKPPQPVVLPMEDAAAAYGRELSRRLAEASAEVAKRAAAGEFDDLTAANDVWVEKSKAIHRDVYGGLIVRSQNNELTDERGKPGTAAAPMFGKMASGFGRGAK